MSGTRLFGRRSQPYPDAANCIGTHLGRFNNKEWWHAIGTAHDLFIVAEPDITEELRSAFTDTYCSIHFHLYMIGSCKASARPTIVFFCEEKEPRKRAQKIIQEGGILDKLAGFRTGHQARQPTIGALVLPATGMLQYDGDGPLLSTMDRSMDDERLATDSAPRRDIESLGKEGSRTYNPMVMRPDAGARNEPQLAATEVYYDPLQPFQALGTRIFVRHRNGKFRRAMGFAVMKGKSCLLMTVSHAFLEEAAEPVETENDDDSDFDLGGDTESEEEEEDFMEITSRASVSSHNSPADDETTPHSESLESSNSPDIMDLERRSEKILSTGSDRGDFAEHEFNHSEKLFPIDENTNLQQLGSLYESSIDQDWALITMTSEYIVEAFLDDLAEVSKLSRGQVATDSSEEKVLARLHNKAGGVLGNILADASYVRLPGSTTFQKLYHVSLNEPLSWGDCGALILGAKTCKLYGHVVASSQNRRVALVIPAHRILQASQTRWELKSSMRFPKKEEVPHNRFKFITAKHPDEFKSKAHMIITRKQAMDHHMATQATLRKASRSRRDAFASSRSFHNKTDKIGFVTAERLDHSNRKEHMTTVRKMWIDHHLTIYTIPHSAKLLLEAGPIVEPLGPGPLPYYTHRAPLFQSIGKALDPFQTMFHPGHTQFSVEELKNDFSRYFGTRSMGRYWIPTVLEHTHTFLGTLCLATAYNDVEYELPLESVQTVALRQEIIHLVRKNILDPSQSTADHNILAVAQLIASELISQEETGLKYHQNGIESMIRQRGGLEQLGLERRLASVISWLSIESAIFQEEQPVAMYSEYCASHATRIYPATATIPESPIYLPHPRTGFYTLTRSGSCSSRSLEILEGIRLMVDLFLKEAQQSRRRSLDIFRRITDFKSYPSIADLRRNSVLREPDYRYESIRITSILVAAAIVERTPLSNAVSEASQHYRSLPSSFIGSAPHSLKSLASPFDSKLYMLESEFVPTNLHRASSTSSASSFRSESTNITQPSVSSVYSMPPQSSISEYFPSPPVVSVQGAEVLLQDLKDALKTSNMSQCWSDMAGVLLWIALTASAASHKSGNKTLKKYFSALAVRVSFMLCFEHPEAMHATVTRMAEFIEALRTANGGTAPTDWSSKRRKR